MLEVYNPSVYSIHIHEKQLLLLLNKAWVVKMSHYAMSTIVLVLLMLVVDIGRSQTPVISTCDQLPKDELPSIETLVAHSPFTVYYASPTSFECATVVFTKAARGTTGYSGTALNIRGSTVNVKDFIIDKDKKALRAKSCQNGEPTVWHLFATRFDHNGGSFCGYTCNEDGLGIFLCNSNNGTTPAQLKAVQMARQVPNGNLIDDAQAKCSSGKDCQVFH